MYKILSISIGIAYFLTASLFHSYAQTSPSEKNETYVFRNDDRPIYDKNISVAQLEEMQNNQNITLIDVRLTEDFKLDPILIPGAEYKNPENISNWVENLPKDKKIVLYCVKGAWVSHKAATYLNQKGYDVSTLDGGVRDWKAVNK